MVEFIVAIDEARVRFTDDALLFFLIFTLSGSFLASSTFLRMEPHWHHCVFNPDHSDSWKIDFKHNITPAPIWTLFQMRLDNHKIAVKNVSTVRSTAKHGS